MRGLARNPAITGELLRQLVDVHLEQVEFSLTIRAEWTGEQVDALVDHPDLRVRLALAGAWYLPPEQRARLVEDHEPRVLRVLANGPDSMDLPFRPRPPVLPGWAYRRLVERRPRLRETIADSRWTPPEIRDELAATIPAAPAGSTASTVAGTPAARGALAGSPLDRRLAEQEVASDDEATRRGAAADPRLPADLVARLAGDPSPRVRLALCETHAVVPADAILATYLDATTINRGRLLDHPSFDPTGLARLADDPDPEARALVARDPDAPAELIEGLSHDPEPAVRTRMAPDRRLSPGRVLELFDDPVTTEYAAANPRLPVEVMRRVLAGGS